MKTLLILLAIAVAAHLYLRKNWSTASASVTPARPRKRHHKPAAIHAGSEVVKAHSNFRASSISCDASACEKARALQEKRLLRASVPSLPLAGCDAERCECRYRHHEDRRDDLGDRRALSSLGSDLYADAHGERRNATVSRGRRSEDRLH